MKLVLKILATILLIIVLGGLILPNDFKVERSIVIKATNHNIHQYVNDLKRWPRWSPWLKQDPSIKIVLGDITEGVGASQQWTAKGGGGHLMITQSSAESGIDYNFYFEGDDTAYPASIHYSEGKMPITVTWSMHGQIDHLILGPYIAMLMNPMVGKSFSEGLNRLKSVIESDG